MFHCSRSWLLCSRIRSQAVGFDDTFPSNGTGWLISLFQLDIITDSCYTIALKTDPGLPVMVAGDPERKHMAQVDAEGGIRYHNNHIKSLVSIYLF